MNKSIQSRPRDWKTHFFRSDVHAKILIFFEKKMIRVAMGDVNFKIVPEASVFRGDAYFDGPGAQKYHFWRKRPFWKIIFKNIFSKNIFRDIFFSKKKTRNIFFGKIGLGATLVLGGRARKITPLIYPLIFKNFFGHETGRRGSYGNNSEWFLGRISRGCRIRGRIGHRSLILYCFLELCWANIVVKIFVFSGCAVTKEKRPYWDCWRETVHMLL